MFHSNDSAYKKVWGLEYIWKYFLFFAFLDSINTLTADGKKFSHPLYHLGKTTNDLPVLAIDSFRHMYMWPNNPKDDIEWVLNYSGMPL